MKFLCLYEMPVYFLVGFDPLQGERYLSVNVFNAEH